ncbi:MAG: hypothetical protein ACE5FG_05555 [Myxococcota bacterium]
MLRCVLPVGLLLLAGGSSAAAEVGTKSDLTGVDLSGAWYVLIHYRDDRSTDPSVRKFKDFGWAVEQSEGRIVWRRYPYVVFDDETEEVRRHAMMEHLYWEPDAQRLAELRERLRVSPRAATRKVLLGSVSEGFRSQSAPGPGGANVLTFSRSWELQFEPARIRLTIVDSLSGGGGLEGMEEATVFDIVERVGGGELRGIWREGENLKGSFRMLRAEKLQLLD